MTVFQYYLTSDMSDHKKIKDQNNQGHRGRLRERFLTSGLDGFLDYEIVELLLTLGTPRKDCKNLAKDAIGRFKGLVGVLNASTEELQQINGIGPSNAYAVLLFKALLKRYKKEKIQPDLLLNSPQTIFEYLREKIGGEHKEFFILLCLDIHNHLIESTVSTGTLNASIVHPREVFHQAILNHASHVIIAHNHPSGDPTPSDEDITTTSRLVEAGKILGISVVDHMIITSDNYTSLKQLGYIQL